MLHYCSQPYLRAVELSTTSNINRRSLRAGRPGFDSRLRHRFSEGFYLVGHNTV
jgi:hypothetical protein